MVQLCLILCKPMDCSPRGSSVLGIFQARILEWVSISFPHGIGDKESPWPTKEMQKTRVHSLGEKDPLVKEMATHSSILA